jgi:hypothetical protein
MEDSLVYVCIDFGRRPGAELLRNATFPQEKESLVQRIMLYKCALHVYITALPMVNAAITR